MLFRFNAVQLHFIQGLDLGQSEINPVSPKKVCLQTEFKIIHFSYKTNVYPTVLRVFTLTHHIWKNCGFSNYKGEKPVRMISFGLSQSLHITWIRSFPNLSRVVRYSGLCVTNESAWVFPCAFNFYYLYMNMHTGNAAGKSHSHQQRYD